MNLSAKFLMGRKHGFEVCQLLVWRNGKLVHVSTHWSEGGARIKWEEVMKQYNARAA